MSYSDSQAELVLFSSDRERLEELVATLRTKLEKKGSEYKGPHKHTLVKPDMLAYFLHHLNDPESDDTLDRDSFPQWLFEVANSREHIDHLTSVAENQRKLHSRKFMIIGERGIHSVFSFDLPEDIFAAAEIGERSHQKGGQHGSYTWDPNVDHIPSHPDGNW